VDTLTVIKVSGREVDDDRFLSTLCRALAAPAFDRRLILVHGGGKEISAAMERYGQSVQFVDGLRVTPPESMEIMQMVVCGSINKRIVAKLVAEGRQALGLGGMDLGLLRCVPYRPDGVNLERVGIITAVAVETLQTMLTMGWLPVFAPVAVGQHDNLPYNVNADQVAQAIAAALTGAAGGRLTELVFVSNVPGVLQKGQVVPHLTASDIEQAIQAGVITDGMIPKVRAALDALQAGVAVARITNLEGLASGGTRIV
jgi:acetylglutamate kinase